MAGHPAESIEGDTYMSVTRSDLSLVSDDEKKKMINLQGDLFAVCVHVNLCVCVLFFSYSRRYHYRLSATYGLLCLLVRPDLPTRDWSRNKKKCEYGGHRGHPSPPHPAPARNYLRARTLVSSPRRHRRTQGLAPPGQQTVVLRL